MKSSYYKILILLLFVNLATFSCLPQTIQVDTPVPTAIGAIATASATLPAEPTFPATTTPVISFDGPQLIYQTYGGSNNDPVVYVMNFDGTGKKKLDLPSGFEIRFLKNAVSPDGKWLAFHTGSEESKNIALNLFSVETGESFLITHLLSPDYPDNFEKALARIQSSTTDLFGKAEITRANLELHFELTRVSWSPDGRFLAFAGEMDGPTSDLYIYDLENRTIKRMFDDLLNIGFLEWADDGKVIYFSNIVPGEIYSWSIDYTINIEDSHIQELDTAGWSVTDVCFGSEICFWHLQGDGGDPFAISLLEVASGKDKTLWGPTFQDYAVSLQDELIIVSGPYAEEPEPGTYFVDFSGKRRKISDLFFGRFIYWDAAEPCFIGTVTDGVYRISLDGTIQKISDGDYYEFSISPDGKWLIAYNINSPYVDAKGFLLLNNKLEVVQIIGDEKTDYLVWQPDSSGLFFTTKNLYHVSMPDGELQFVENNTNVSFGEYDYRWIP